MSHRLPSSGSVLLRSASLIALATTLSGISGYLRDASIAARLGASKELDAFFIGYSWQDFVVTGAAVTISVWVIPRLTASASERGQRLRVAGGLLAVVSLLAIIATVGMALTADQMVGVLGPGLSKAQHQEAVRAMLIVTPGTLFILIASAVVATLNSQRFFFAPALSIPIYNLLIAATAITIPRPSTTTIAAAATIGAGVQLVFLLGLVWYRRLLASPSRTDVLRIWSDLPALGPLLVGSFLAYSPLAVDRAIASHFAPGAVTQLNLGFRMATTVEQLIGSALALAAFPLISAALARDDRREVTAILRHSLQTAGGLGLVALLVGIPWRLPLTDLLYSYGRFSADAALITASVFAVLLVGFVVDGMAQVLWRVQFSQRRNSVFVLLNLAQLFANTVFALLLAPAFGLPGIAAGLALGLTVQFVLLVVLTRGFLEISDLLRTLRNSVGNLALGFVPFAAAEATSASAVAGLSLLAQVATMTAVTAVGLVWVTSVVSPRLLTGARDIVGPRARKIFALSPMSGSVKMVLVAALGLATGCLVCLVDQAIVVVALAATAAVVAILLVDRAVRSTKIDLLAPAIGFPIAYAIYFGIGSINILPGPPAGFGWALFLKPISLSTPLLAFLGLVAYYAGVAAVRWARGGVIRLVPQVKPLWRFQPTLAITAAVTLLGFGLIAVAAIRAGVPLLSGSALLSRIALPSANGIANTIYVTFLVGAAPLAAIGSMSSGKDRPTWVRFAWPLMLGSVGAASIVLVSRGLLLEAILLAIPILHYTVKGGLRIWQVLATATCVGAFIGVFGYLRDSQFHGSTDIFTGLYVKLGFPAWSTPFIQAYTYLRGSVAAFDALTQTIPTYFPFQYGQITFHGLSDVLPGHQDSADILIQHLLGISFSGQGIPATLLGAFYMDFGATGIVVGMTLMGAVLQWLYARFRERLTPGSLLAYGYALYLALHSIFNTGPFVYLDRFTVAAMLIVITSYINYDARIQSGEAVASAHIPGWVYGISALALTAVLVVLVKFGAI